MVEGGAGPSAVSGGTVPAARGVQQGGIGDARSWAGPHAVGRLRGRVGGAVRRRRPSPARGKQQAAARIAGRRLLFAPERNASARALWDARRSVAEDGMGCGCAALGPRIRTPSILSVSAFSLLRPSRALP